MDAELVRKGASYLLDIVKTQKTNPAAVLPENVYFDFLPNLIGEMHELPKAYIEIYKAAASEADEESKKRLDELFEKIVGDNLPQELSAQIKLELTKVEAERSISKNTDTAIVTSSVIIGGAAFMVVAIKGLLDIIKEKNKPRKWWEK
ncbi:MAG: hypothetical protein ACYDCX_12020 [Acidithiobacillus sp.]